MTFEIFIPHNTNEQENCTALEDYLNNMFFC